MVLGVYLLYGVLALITFICYRLLPIYQSFNFFKNRGISQFESNFISALYKGLFKRRQECPGLKVVKYYWKFKKMGLKHGGVNSLGKQAWVPVDPDLIKTILVKDFTHFSAHFPKMPGMFFNNLFHFDGEEWKDMRKKLTPTFTSGKMKMMYDMVLEKSNGLAHLVEQSTKSGKAAEIKSLLARYTTDVIGTCGFGIDCNSIEDENSVFFQQGQKIFTNTTKTGTALQQILLLLGIKKRGVEFLDLSEIEDFFRNIVSQTLKYREENKIIRKDFVHLMIQLKNKGAVTELTNENEDVFEKKTNKDVMSMEDITGQILLFFQAGFETSSTNMSYALLELTQNQDIQQKLRKEVREVLKRHDGKFTYEALQEMTYLNNVVYESLRKYPPLPVLPRLCTKNYTIPGTNSVLPKNTTVEIPVWGLQMDPEYFPDPEKFIPERFSAENKSKIKDFTFMPFGEGPRMCLGLRFGVMQSKIGLAVLINKFNFTLNKRTKYPPEYHKNSFVLAVEGGIWLNAVRVD